MERVYQPVETIVKQGKEKFSGKTTAKDREFNMDNIQKQIILGSILGDGCVALRKRMFKRKNGVVVSESLVFTEGHTLPQEDYIIWKNKFLNFSLCRYKNVVSISKEIKKNSFFRKIREEIYINGKKRIVSHQIAEELDDLGLLVWYLDDGSICYPSITFCTDSFYKASQKRLVKMLKQKFGVVAKIKKIINHNRWKGTKKQAYRIIINAENVLILIKTLKETFNKYNLPDCMSYKVNLPYQISKFKKRNRNYYIQNKDRVKESQKIYFQKNRDEILNWRKNYRNLNRTNILIKSRKNWEINKDRYNLTRRIKNQQLHHGKN